MGLPLRPFPVRGPDGRQLPHSTHAEALRLYLVEGRGIARAAEFSFERLTVERVEALRSILGLPPTPLAAKYAPIYSNAFSTLPEITT